MARHNEGGGIYLRGGRWFFKQRVPRRFEALDPRRPVRIALKTDSERKARIKAPGIASGLRAYWEALEAGDATEAKAPTRRRWRSPRREASPIVRRPTSPPATTLR